MLRTTTDLTADTTRVTATAIPQFAATIAKLVWPDRKVFWRPRSAVLLPLGRWRESVAGVSLMHFPNNAALLATRTNVLSGAARSELIRLKPSGIGTDGERLPAQVFLIGNISTSVRQAVRGLGFRTTRIRGKNSLETAAMIARHMAEMMPHPPTLLVPYASAQDSQPVVAIAAHTGAPILFVNENTIPAATRNVLKEIDPEAVYIVGRNSQISSALKGQVEVLLPETRVLRVGGASITELSVNLAKFKDFTTDFGWGKTEKQGDIFSFVKAGNVYQSIYTATLAHLATHAPELILPVNHTVPEVLRDYLISINPPLFKPPKPPFMRGWIIGDHNDITVRQQIILESLLIKEQGDWPPQG